MGHESENTLKERYIVTHTDHDTGTIWYVKDTHLIPPGCNPYIVARCSSQRDAERVKKALNVQPLASMILRCDKCGRVSRAPDAKDGPCGMPMSDMSICIGTMRQVTDGQQAPHP